MVKNISGNSLAISLEKGSTILAKGKKLDLDGLCSRKWIRENKELQHLLNPNINALALMHDSEVGVPPQPTHDARKNVPKSKPKKKEKPVIIDFSDVGEPEQDEPIVEDLSEPEPEEVKKVVEARAEQTRSPRAEQTCSPGNPCETGCRGCSEELVKEDTDDEMTIEEPTWDEDKKEEALPDGMVACPVCGKLCRGERGLKAHMRAHKDD